MVSPFMVSPFLLFIPLTLVTISHAFTFTVTVGIDETNGQPGLGFDPSTINPVAGDTIAFTFQLPSYIKTPNSTQHSATQSTFDSPCTSKSGGFDTGVQSTGSSNSNTGETFSLLVNDTQPLWFFSSPNSDCNSEMVLAVNPPTSGDQTAAAFKEKAKSAPKTTASLPSSTFNGTPSSSSSQAGPTATTSLQNGACQGQANGYLNFMLTAIVMGLSATGL